MDAASVQTEVKRVQAEYQEACRKAAQLEERAKAMRATAKTAYDASMAVLNRMSGRMALESPATHKVRGRRRRGEGPSLIDAFRAIIGGLSGRITVHDVKQAVLATHPQFEKTPQSSWSKNMVALVTEGKLRLVSPGAGKRAAIYGKPDDPTLMGATSTGSTTES
jgi:hypothetical protein